MARNNISESDWSMLMSWEQRAHEVFTFTRDQLDESDHPLIMMRKEDAIAVQMALITLTEDACIRRSKALGALVDEM